jgi:hypothetical protein
MPKFKVVLGRLVRETASVIVEAPSLDELEGRLSEVYRRYDGDWAPDVEWGCEESDSHAVTGKAPSKSKVDIKLS